MPKQGSSNAGKPKVESSDNSTSTLKALPSSSVNTSIPTPFRTPIRLPGSAHIPTIPKVAIPRLRPQSEDQPTSKAALAGDKNRVAHACEPCRHRKTKCSGERPICQHCQDHNLTCVYADGKRDRTKKQLGTLAGKIEEYEQLLEELSLRAGVKDQELIQKALENDQSSDEIETQAALSPRGRTRVNREPAGEDKISARVGSTESMDRISEDFTRDANARATGFHGKNSELTWMQRLKRQASHGSDDSDEYEDTLLDGHSSPTSQSHHSGSGLAPISASSYHCDDLTVFVNGQIDMRDMPAPATASHLFQSYLETVHSSFPIIGKNSFTAQYQSYYKNPDQANPNQNWLAILNMIFAIGAKYSHLICAGWRGHEGDHLIYFTRARMLGFNSEDLLGHADLQKVQITGLMAFYLMAVNQISRSWAVSGIAIRHASTLGLNLRNESKDVSDSSKEIRYRVWWALCSIESILAVMTGRPTSFAETDCTAPLPIPFEEDAFSGPQTQSPQAIQMLRRRSSQESRQDDYALPTPASAQLSSKKQSPKDPLSPAESQTASRPTSRGRKKPYPPCNALAFEYHTRLSTLTVEVLNRLYRAGLMTVSWAQVQATMSSLNAKLESWRRELPSVFDFTVNSRDQEFRSQRMSLGFSYYSTLIIINRPCLCRIDRKIPDESERAKNFNRETAATCVHAARDVLNLLPTEPNFVGLYKVAPWWCLVHCLMQAATVLMLELSFRANHMPTEVDEVFESAKKAVGWLRSMSKRDEAARRGYVLCDDLLRQVAKKVGRTASEVPDFQPDGVYQSNGGSPMQSVPGMQETQDKDVGYPAISRYPAQFDYSTPTPFQPQMFTSYDQILSYGQLPTTSTQAPFDDMFPTAHEMDGMSFDEHESPNYFSGPGPRWFPGDGTGQ